MIMRTNKLNSTAKLAFYNARKRDGDVKRLAETTGYSVSHITNIMNGTRNVNDEVANAMYKISARRQKVSEMA
jgi:plasmid maintenance system antidote protein VapI